MKFQRPKILTYQDTIRFHGHNGPFLALGYKLGKHINSKHRPEGIMGLNIIVKVKPEKPFTCLIDGLQCSTFATMGKGNMTAKISRGKAITVSVVAGKKKYTYYITQQAMDICLGAEDLDKAARKIFRTPFGQLFNLSLP
ncbi:MAG: FmdE family protein [bacterium]